MERSLSQHLVERALVLARVDFAPSHRQPATWRVVLATAAAALVCLIADAFLVKLGTSLFPSTKGYSHFRLSDYGVLTVIGIAAAGVSWPVVTRITSAPRWVFLRLAVLVTVLLWLPDAWLLLKGEPPAAVAVLMTMHLVIAVVTYNLLVHGAPAGTATAPARRLVESAGAERKAPAPPGEKAGTAAAPNADAGASLAETTGAGQKETAETAPPALVPDRLAWILMASGVALEFALGIVALLAVPLGRPDKWVPSRGVALYLAHAVLGALLGAASLALLFRSRWAPRITRIGAAVGFAGLALGVGGGVLAAYHALRVAGLGLMLIGAVTAGFGYLIPIVG